VLGDQCLQLRHDIRMATEREVCLDPFLKRRQSKLIEPRDRPLRERLVGKIGERRPAPHRERLAQLRGRDGRLGLVRLADEVLEPVQVKLVPFQPHDVPGFARETSAPARPSALRSCDTRTCSAVRPDSGVSPPHSSSIRRSADTTWLAFKSRTAAGHAALRQPAR
jgi:hypothetical protein